MVSVSKKMVLAVAALVAALLIGNVVQLVSSDGAVDDRITDSTMTGTTDVPVETDDSSTSTSPESSSSTTPSTSTSTTVSIPSTTKSGTSKGIPFFEPLSLAVLHTKMSTGFSYESQISIEDDDVSSSGTVDIVGNRSSLLIDTGDDFTEMRRSGNTIYVNAERLGATGSTWVAVQNTEQVHEVAVRSVRSIMRSLTPEYLLETLSSASNIERVVTNSSGIHFRAKVSKAITAFAPLFDVIDSSSGSGETTVDVWIDTTFYVSRMMVSTDDVSITHTLTDFGSSPTVTIPAAGDTGALDSSSGGYLFGTSTPIPRPSSAVHGLSIQPSVEIDDGIIRGTLGAVSATAEALRYEFVASSAGGKLEFGVVPTNGSSVDPQSFTVLPYAAWLDQGPGKGNETFDVKVRETTDFGEYITGLPLIGEIAAPVIDLLQDSSAAPRLASIIGIAVEAPIQVSTNALAPADTPVAFTYRITSFDGTRISVNFFPASGLGAGQTASTILEAASLGGRGVTNPYAIHDGRAFVPGPATLRDNGFNVITWDQRGSYASSGTMQLVHAYYEGRDISEIVSWFGYNTPANLNGPNDPSFGMVGGSAGGASQLLAAGTDPRTDAIVPAATWNSLATSLASSDVVNTSATRAFLAALDSPQIRLSPQLRQALVDGITDGRFSEDDVARLAGSGIGAGLSQTQAPALLIHSTNDRMFPLSESIDTAQSILSNPYGTPTKIIWTDGDESDSAAMGGIRLATVSWLQKYVMGVPIPDSQQPNFRYWDQNGQAFDSNLYPFQAGFNEPSPVEATSTGATLGFASPASGTITLTAQIDNSRSIVGRPSLSFTYTGSGTARAVFARVIDSTTGKALNPAATPIPVTLDGSTRTVSVSLQDIVFSGGVGSNLTVEIKPTNSSFVQLATGQIAISDVVASFPIKSP